MALKTPKLDQSGKQSAYQSYLDEEEKKNVPEEDDSYLAGYEPGSIGYQNAKANYTPRGMDTNISQAIPGLLGPSQYVQDALSVSPEKRTSAQREALKVRRRNEEIAMKGGRRVQNGISQELINEEVAPDIARRETKAALAYKNASEQTLAENGRNPDGSKITPEQAAASSDAGSPTPSTTKATSGGTIKRGNTTVNVPGAPADAAPSAPAPRGFAMRTMADGTVKTASGVVGNNSNIQSFGTQAEALAYYQPQPAPAMPVPNGPAGTPPTVMTAHNGQPAAYAQPAPAPAPAMPAPVAPPGAAAQTPAAARTTSPTQQLATSIANGPAPVAPARPPSGNPREPLADAPPAPSQAPTTPYAVNPFVRDQMLQAPQPTTPQAVAQPPIAKAQPPAPLYGRGLNTTFKPNLPDLATANRSFGTPKRKTGYQQQAEDLNPMALHR